MKLTTQKTKQYALLIVKMSTGGVTQAERGQYDRLVAEMAKPEPRKKKAAAKNAAAKKPAGAPKK